MKIGKWSTNAGSNNSTPPDGWPEGQAPSTVNDCAREMMAAIRTMAANIEYIDLGNSPTYASATSFRLDSSDTNFHVGRRLKLFDATTLYGTINSVSGTFVQVRLDSGQLTASLSSVALGSPNLNHALPDAATTQQNAIINGDMDIWQRGTFFGDVQNFQYTADRFMFEQGNNVTAHGTILQKPQSASTDMVPTVFQCGRYINNSLQYVVTATQAVLAANDYAMITQVVEGYTFRPLAFQPMTLSFWVNTNKSGVYSVAIRNEAADTSYVTAFTVTAISAYSRFCLRLPPTVDGATWNFDTQAGLRVTWTLAAGVNLTTTPDTWTADNVVAVPTQVNLLDTAFNYFNLAAVELKRGWDDTPVAQRQYGEELALCQRYYWRGLPFAEIGGQCFADNAVLAFPVRFPVTMRDTPLLSSDVSTVTLNFADTLAWDKATPQGAVYSFQGNTVGTYSYTTFGPTDYFAADAEL